MGCCPPVVFNISGGDESPTDSTPTLITETIIYGTGSTQFDPTAYPGLQYIDVEVQGAGGGSGSVAVTAAGQVAVSGAGGAGGYARVIMNAGILGTAPVPVVVSAGGAGGAAGGVNPGQTGSDTYFGFVGGNPFIVGASPGGNGDGGAAQTATSAVTPRNVVGDGEQGFISASLDGVTRWGEFGGPSIVINNVAYQGTGGAAARGDGRLIGTGGQGRASGANTASAAGIAGSRGEIVVIVYRLIPAP